MNRKKGTMRSRYILALGLALLAFAIASSRAADIEILVPLPSVDVAGSPLEDLASIRYYVEADTNAFVRGTNWIAEVDAVTNAPTAGVFQTDVIVLDPYDPPIYLAVTAVDTSGNESQFNPNPVLIDADIVPPGPPGDPVIVHVTAFRVRPGDELEVAAAIREEDWRAIARFLGED